MKILGINILRMLGIITIKIMMLNNVIDNNYLIYNVHFDYNSNYC